MSWSRWATTKEGTVATTTDITIACPKCKAEIRLTEAMAGPLVANARADFDRQLAERAREGERQLADARTSIEHEARHRATLAAAADIAARDRALADAREVLKVNNEKLAEAQEAQALAVRTQRQLEDERRELALTVERQVAAGVTAARAAARTEAEATIGLRVAERDEQIAGMNRVIEDLRRKAEQGSQQLQGEAQELALEAALRERFPLDEVSPVPKGEFGGDAVHRVVGGAGTILWEFKRTKNWSDGWLPKLRSDGRAAKADVLVLVTQAMGPAGVDNPRGFEQVDGVWVVHYSVAMQVASALRYALLSTTAARRASEGQETKAEATYRYLTGPRFRQRVEAIVEAFTVMRRDLDAEKKAITRLWAKREEQLGRVVETTAGMYGDLQGIAGAAAGELEALKLPALEGPT
jgi:hypothetical protein